MPYPELLGELERIAMPTRNVVLIEQREARDKAKLAALKETAAVGFRDIEEGRFHEFGEGGLEEFMSSLGQQASKCIKNTGR